MMLCCLRVEACGSVAARDFTSALINCLSILDAMERHDLLERVILWYSQELCHHGTNPSATWAEQ